VWPVMNAAPSEARNSAAPTTSSTVPKRPSVPRIGTCGDDELVLKSGPDGITVGEPITSSAGRRAPRNWSNCGDGRSSSRRQNGYICRLTASQSRSRLLDNVLESGSGDPGGPGEQRCRVFTAPLLLFLPCAE